jgi:2-oxoisovalerate dehydrogenase E1 component
VNARTISPEKMDVVTAHIDDLRAKANAGEISIGDAINLAIHEEMLRDPTTAIHAEDLQAGSSYDIPKLTQQTYGKIRAADEIIDEGHFIGKALCEGMNGYRPIVELMNTNFGILGMAELSSAGNTYARRQQRLSSASGWRVRLDGSNAREVRRRCRQADVLPVADAATLLH